MKIINNVPVKREFNNNNRLPIPKDIRDYYNINQGDMLSLYLTDEGILIKKEL